MRSTRRFTKPGASMPVATWQFAGWPMRDQRSTSVRPRESSHEQSTSTRRYLVSSSARLRDLGDGDGVVDRRAGPAVLLGMEAAVEAEQVGDDPARAAGDAHPPGFDIADERLVGDVEPDHRQVDPAREDAAGGLRIGPDVELGGRRDVALGDRSAHQDDALDPLLDPGVEREQEGDVRQRSDRDDGDRRARQRSASQRGSRPRGGLSGSRLGGGRSGPSRPDSPWT